MNDIRRTILWVIFGFSMVLLWDQWQTFNGKQPTFFPKATQPVGAAAPVPSGASSPVPTSGVGSTPAPASIAVSPSAVPLGAPVVATAAKREKLIVATDVFTLTFDTEGGSLVRSSFNKFKDMLDKNAGFVLLDESAGRVYVAQTGLIAASGGSAMPTHKSLMTAVPGERTLAAGQNELQVKFESPEIGGIKLVKTYTLRRGAYDIAVRHDIVNTGSMPVSPQLYLQLVRDGNAPLGESAFYSTFTGPAIYTEAQKYQKIDFKDIEKGTMNVEKQASNGYVAMVQHYFASAWLLGDGIKRELFQRKVDTNLYAVGMITSLGELTPGTTKTIESRLFVGPQEENMLEKLTPGLELVKDYGWLTILAKPLPPWPATRCRLS